MDSIRHRGPDACGVWVDPRGRFALGHNRLAILDLRPESNQPFWSACGRFVIVFNGEIFNYLEIRANLEAEGCAFRTSSDTEVLLQALIRQGPDAVSRFNGMWAFVFVDTQTGEVLTCRDRWGVKPLFVHESRGEIVVASEAKAILRYHGTVPEPNHESIGLFLKYSVGGEHSESWFRGIRRFPPGQFQVWKPESTSPRVGSYWQYPSDREPMEDDLAGERLVELLTDAIRIRLRSDVPLCLSLSGGLDSSVIAWLVRERFQSPLESFTAWFEPVARSELARARAVASQFGHTIHPVAQPDPANTINDLRTCIYHLDAGNSSPAVVPYLNLCREARKTSTVMLEGQGADELLLGYSYLLPFAAMHFAVTGHPLAAIASLGGHIRSDGWIRTAQEWIRLSSRRVYEAQHMRWDGGLITSRVMRQVAFDDCPLLGLSRMNAHDALVLRHRTGLTNLLQYGDAVSMAVSMETRCPFLDYRLVDFGFRIPMNLLVRGGHGKYLLRKIASNVLPSEVVWPRRKDGFTNQTVAMIRESIRADGPPEMGCSLAIDHGIFSPRIRDGAWLCSMEDAPLFRVFSVLLWLETFYGSVPSRA